MRSLGVDLGGHNLRVAMVEDGRIVEHAREATASDRGMQAVLAQIARLARQVTAGAEGVPLCVGVPAFLDIQREVALRMPNFPGWEGAPLAAELRRHIDAPLTLENDANCYAVGEGRFGAARGYDSFVVLTLGTGIGGGIVLGRRLLRGSRGMAAEPGHLVMGGDAPCGCGGKGHLETLAAADAIERKARARGLPPDAEALWKRRDEEGPGAIWEETLDLLARGIASIVHLLDPEAVVLGGGMSRAEGLVEALQRRVEPCLASPLKGRVPLVAASLGDDAALLGAASLAVGMLRKEEEDV